MPPESIGWLRPGSQGTPTRTPDAAGFPPGPLGDASLGLLSDPLAFLRDTRAEYGGVAGMLLGGERIVVVSDPEAARQVGGHGGEGHVLLQQVQVKSWQLDTSPGFTSQCQLATAVRRSFRKLNTVGTCGLL
jgi:hypothetical protein